MKKQKYSAKGFRDRFGREETIRICLLAGTTYANFKHIIAGRARPSAKLAHRLVRASDFRLDFELLMPESLPNRTRNLLPQYKAKPSINQEL